MESRSLQSKPSEETLVSLLQLDPSPIETPPADTEKDLPPLPEDALEDSTGSLRSTSSAPGLSGSGHSAIFYQPLLVALPIVAHVASGIALRLVRRSQNLKRYGGNTPGMYALYRAQTGKSSRSLTSNSTNSAGRIWPPVSYISISGYVFTALLAAHVGINRLLPLYVEGDSSNIGLAFVSHGFVQHPFASWLAYTSLLTVGCGHMIWGAARWLGLAPTAMGWSGSGTNVVDKKVRKRKRRSWWALHGIAAAAAGIWAAGGLGVVARGA
ncbi:uncharacterized protein ColSpa_11460 [Colletotrichum spaethianum]|uniref:Mitochondrial adapter protein MCP1 transmembrane domain-containing protein n=1 Tax=Colletotrichum spaethianum TaxID=700344 RepID=A0AA37PFL0_9PEZI|nr:uncharacterized protein ColSpa_11460 [Colletotrichum spaethianum]GKT51279.1 hypothetical protein ColSpa_11460 [Colletotrichum spaethianum]